MKKLEDYGFLSRKFILTIIGVIIFILHLTLPSFELTGEELGYLLKLILGYNGIEGLGDIISRYAYSRIA